MARLMSVNVGLPRDINWEGKVVHTAIWETPVQRIGSASLISAG
jgi:hypothetical protein